MWTETELFCRSILRVWKSHNDGVNRVHNPSLPPQMWAEAGREWRQTNPIENAWRQCSPEDNLVERCSVMLCSQTICYKSVSPNFGKRPNVGEDSGGEERKEWGGWRAIRKNWRPVLRHTKQHAIATIPTTSGTHNHNHDECNNNSKHNVLPFSAQPTLVSHYITSTLSLHSQIIQVMDTQWTCIR
jgi:hypothetical protein